MKKLVCFLIAATLLCIYPVPVYSAEDESAANRRSDFAGRFLANYAVAAYNTRYNNFPSDEANAVLQTGDGYMWFGGYNGLYRYDSVNFTVWNAVSPNGFGSSNIRALYEDSSGVLWVGTNDRGLVAYQDGVFKAYNKAQGLPSNIIRDITEGADGRIYGGTPEGIFYIDRNRNVTAITLDTTAQPAVVSLCADMDGNIYIVLNSGELYVYTNDGRTIRHPHEKPVYSVGCVSGNRMVAGARNGEVLILRFDGNMFTRSEIVSTPLINIEAVYEDSNGFIWLPAENGIGFLDTDEKYQNAGNPNGVGFYSGIWEDYQNGYWITATRGGVIKLAVSAFSDFNSLMNMETGTTNAIVLQDGNMYIGTNYGLLILDAHARTKKPVHTAFSEIFNTRVRGIFPDSKGNIWICTYSELGVVRYTPATGEFRNWTPEDGMATERTRLILELPNGVIAVGTASGVNFIKGDYVVTADEALETDAFIKLPDIMVLSMVCSTDGTLYIGTDGGGVYAINKNGTTRYREENGLTGGVVLRMLADAQGNGVWVGAAPGLCYINSDGQVILIDKVPPHSFLDIMQYHDDLILLTSGMIIRTNAAALLDPESPFVYSAADRESGLNASINANAWNLISDGRLYFCTDSGVGIYSFEHDRTTFVPFAGVARINVDGREYADFSEGVAIPRDADRLTVELSLLSFGLIDEAVLRYMLVGQDREPLTLLQTDNHDISYTNLRGGHYILRVWTEGSAGNMGHFVEINLYKELNFFEHTYVWLIIALLAAALAALAVVAIVRYRTRRLYKKQREYRTIISQALTAIANAIDAKDSYTSGHSARVAAYSVEIALRMGVNKNFIENLYYVGLLHDVGKIGVPNKLINKPGKLTDEEYNIMKQHSDIGHEILKDITTIRNLTAGAAEHHERWDGKGYNRSIAGENISLEARIIAAADTYDAMSSDRSYRKGLPKEVIIEEFKRCAGNQFDPVIAGMVINMIEQDQFDSIDVGKIIGLDNAELPLKAQYAF